MHFTNANRDYRLLLWQRVREFAVPPSMIESATARRTAGDWAGACAAAHVDVDLDLRSIGRTHGHEFVHRLRADLRHLAPDLLRWHMPRVAPDGLLRSGLTTSLVRYEIAGGRLHLVARTAPAWAIGAADHPRAVGRVPARGRISRPPASAPGPAVPSRPAPAPVGCRPVGRVARTIRCSGLECRRSRWVTGDGVVPGARLTAATPCTGGPPRPRCCCTRTEWPGPWSPSGSVTVAGSCWTSDPSANRLSPTPLSPHPLSPHLAERGVRLSPTPLSPTPLSAIRAAVSGCTARHCARPVASRGRSCRMRPPGSHPTWNSCMPA